jgi:molybdopterin/thiamine biosynthesis adenylyltransferase
MNLALYKETLTRQSDLIPMTALNNSITIIGAGAVGAWTTLALAKMGFTNLTVIDYDTVDIVNLNSQLYRYKDINKPKVEALKEIVKDFTDIDITIVNDKYTGAIITSNILIAAVDSMATRKMIWEKNKKIGYVKKFIDPRMGAETALLYVMNPNLDLDIKSYEKTLYDDSFAVQERCTSKSTIYCALNLSGLVSCQVKSIVTNNVYSRITQWDIPKGSMVSWSVNNES